MDIVLLESVKYYIRVLSSASEISKILQYLERQSALAHLVKEPVSKALGAGLYEMKPGPHRLVFIYHEGEIIVIYAFRKRSQRTPHFEISAALRVRDRYLSGKAI